METIQITFGKDKTAIIKGFAIIFMILLHVFGGAGWYDDDIPMNHNEGLIKFMHSFQICVGIFVFMIGYGYAFAKKKDFRYSFIHIKKLLSTYWVILFCLALPAGWRLLCNSEIGGGKELIYNMFGVKESLSWVSWFVYLYIWAMIIMPFAGRIIDKIPYFGTILMVLACELAKVLIWYFVPGFNSHLYWHALYVCFSWTPTILLGYLFAKEKVFQRIRIPNHRIVPMASLAAIFICLYLKMVLPGIKIINFDIIYAPVIILCILLLFSQYNMKWPSKVMQELGDKSVYMWFIHALFFTAATRPVYHHFVMISENLWIVALWTIVISYGVSYSIKTIIEI